MKTVVLDAFAMNPGDLSWESLEALGNCQIFDRTAPAEVLSRAANAQAILTNKTVIDASIIASLPALKYIGVLATGYNVVDLQAASSRNIVVTNVPAYSSNSVTQMVFAHILEHCQNVARHAASVSSGQWSNSKDFAYWLAPLTELQDLIMGIVGYGNIGRKVAKLAQAFGMKVLVATRSKSSGFDGDIEFVDLERLFPESDIVSLHCPLTEKTSNLVDARRLKTMKKTSLLINTGRGPLVNQADLAAALTNGTIAGAGIDVLSKEPPPADNPLLKAPNCLITPHIAWATRAARERLLKVAVENLGCFLKEKPINVVN
jgi:glycerate dehydrogenase